MPLSIDKSVLKISELVSEYTKDVQEEIVERLNHTADEILAYIKSNTPKGNSTNHLADSFVKTKVGTGVNQVIYISSKTKSRLVHLIELGFRHRSGRHVAAQPFMRPAYSEFTPEMLEDIKKIINGG